MRLGEGHGMMFRICVIFLGFSELEHPPWEDTALTRLYTYVLDNEFGLWQDDHVFFRYTTRHWTEHCHLMLKDSDEGLIDAGLRLCDASTMRFRTWWTLYTGRYEPTSALGAASGIGWLHVVERLLDDGISVNSLDERDRLGLWWACHFGNEAVARLLLTRGAAFNRDDPESKLIPELHAASTKGHEAIVRLLLEYQANVNLNHTRYGTALSTASRFGNDSIVNLLIANGADIRAMIPHEVNALITAAVGREESTVRLLLEYGARFCKDDWVGLEAIDDWQRSQLDEAYERVEGKSREETIKILLELELS